MKSRHFVDLSSNNGANAYNAGLYAKAHVLLAIKATQGVGYVDPFWQGWAQKAHANHTSVLHYHFADSSGSGGEQARHLLGVLRANGNGVYKEQYDSICLDIEQGSSLRDPVRFRQEFEGVLWAEGHKNLVVYSDAGFFAEYGPGLLPRRKRLWVADFGSIKVPGWWRLHLWAEQFTDAATIQGIGGSVDCSSLNGAAYTWRRLHHP